MATSGENSRPSMGKNEWPLTAGLLMFVWLGDVFGRLALEPPHRHRLGLELTEVVDSLDSQ